ncbi:hypothetical protein PENTCL1PPCAC_26155, partial [Pristionchus entomophagus]
LLPIHNNRKYLLIPTEKKCTIVLPSQTILQIRQIDLIKHVKHHHGCPRVRMGRTFYTLNYRFPSLCAIPDGDTNDYELSCSAS